MRFQIAGDHRPWWARGVLKWMVGFVIALEGALLIRVF
jgi:hypothetical protein